jgi:hypothetical protein
MKTFSIGIDPGPKSGAICLINDDNEVVHLVDMPETDHEIAELLTRVCLMVNPGAIVYATIEKQWARKGQGISSAFNSGDNYGFLRACLVNLGISFEIVSPTRWERTFFTVKTKSADGSKEKKKELWGIAKRHFPKAEIKLNQADAPLIAFWGLKYFRHDRTDSEDPGGED